MRHFEWFSGIDLKVITQINYKNYDLTIYCLQIALYKMYRSESILFYQFFNKSLTFQIIYTRR